MSYYVEMIRVNSSAINAVGYDGSNLYVEFHSGRTYTHPNVPYYHFEGLLNAESHGGYYNCYIRGKFR
ncbi:MAG: KTSC domain-containing protein [Verrucomicrobia bacterium]|nr:KTSC domain-containing protein [Verrucomicrobiota bacterium]